MKSKSVRPGFGTHYSGLTLFGQSIIRIVEPKSPFCHILHQIPAHSWLSFGLKEMLVRVHLPGTILRGIPRNSKGFGAFQAPAKAQFRSSFGDHFGLFFCSFGRPLRGQCADFVQFARIMHYSGNEVEVYLARI